MSKQNFLQKEQRKNLHTNNLSRFTMTLMSFLFPEKTAAAAGVVKSKFWNLITCECNDHPKCLSVTDTNQFPLCYNQPTWPVDRPIWLFSGSLAGISELHAVSNSDPSKHTSRSAEQEKNTHVYVRSRVTRWPDNISACCTNMLHLQLWTFQSPAHQETSQDTRSGCWADSGPQQMEPIRALLCCSMLLLVQCRRVKFQHLCDVTRRFFNSELLLQTGGRATAAPRCSLRCTHQMKDWEFINKQKGEKYTHNLLV